MAYESIINITHTHNHDDYVGAPQTIYEFIKKSKKEHKINLYFGIFLLFDLRRIVSCGQQSPQKTRNRLPFTLVFSNKKKTKFAIVLYLIKLINHSFFLLRKNRKHL